MKDVLWKETCGVELLFIQCNPKVDFLTPLIPKPKPIPSRWTECNPIYIRCTLTLTSQCQADRQMDRQAVSNIHQKTFILRGYKSTVESNTIVLSAYRMYRHL